MAGFSLSEEYDVPRTKVDLPLSILEITNSLFRGRSTYQREQESSGGDTGEAARNFLDDTLPYLAEVAVQDGMYLVRDFPKHQISYI